MKLPTTPDEVRSRLISSGIHNLKQFGYPTVTAENIMTDQIYRAFFKSMLEESLEVCKRSRRKKLLYPVMETMIAEIEALDKKEKKKK